MLLINMETGHVWDVDPYAVAGRGLPEGYVRLDEVTKEQLAERIQQLYEGK